MTIFTAQDRVYIVSFRRAGTKRYEVHESAEAAKARHWTLSCYPENEDIRIYTMLLDGEHDETLLN